MRCISRLLGRYYPAEGAALVLLVCTLVTSPLLIAATPLLKTFDLPAGAAERSLKLFSEQSGREVLFATQAVRAVQTRAVKGEMTVREAIERMLADTDLVVFQDEKSGVFSVRGKTAAEKYGQRAAQATPNDSSRDSQKKKNPSHPRNHPNQ